MQDANDLLMSGGTKSCKFDTLGDTWVGTITEDPKVQQMKKYQSDELDFWPSGDPKMQILCTIQTDARDDAEDDGRRVLYIIPRMMPVVREAVQKAGAKGLAVGGRIAVKWVSGTGQGAGNPKQYAAQYEPPQVDPGNLLGGGNDAQAAPPAAQQPAGNMLAPPAAAPATPAATQPPAQQAGPPPGVDPQVWATLPDAQRQAVLAAMGQPAAPAADPFAPQQPF